LTESPYSVEKSDPIRIQDSFDANLPQSCRLALDDVVLLWLTLSAVLAAIFEIRGAESCMELIYLAEPRRRSDSPRALRAASSLSPINKCMTVVTPNTTTNGHQNAALLHAKCFPSKISGAMIPRPIVIGIVHERGILKKYWCLKR
jgi:hypothetical protein